MSEDTQNASSSKGASQAPEALGAPRVPGRLPLRNFGGTWGSWGIRGDLQKCVVTHYKRTGPQGPQGAPGATREQGTGPLWNLGDAARDLGDP